MPSPSTLEAERAPNAWGAAVARLRRRAWRTLAFVAALCLGIALLLAAVEGGGFGTKLIYSMCIGGACLAVTDGARLALAWAVDRWRAARGLLPGPCGFGSGWRGVAPAALLAMLAGPPLGMALADRVTGLRSPSLLELGASNTRITFVLSLLATLVSVYVLSTMERMSAARAQAEAAQRRAAENQLRLLQSQLEPHMLFNTLANLRVLIGVDPARAQAMLDHLIAFLRATLGASRADARPLAAEFEHLADYLALMAVRMGPRLAVHVELPAELRATPVPPLLLQPLVENAIKHGLEPAVEGGRVEVSARRSGDELWLEVRDSGVGLGVAQGVPGSAFGLEQVRTRLATLYGGRAAFELQPAAGGGTLARVRLPIAEAA